MSGESTQPTASLFERYRLSDLPPFAKLFVAIFTSLMLLVCLWAVWIFYETKGKIGDDALPLYMQTTSIPVDSATVSEEISQDIAEIAIDSEAVQAPVWDSIQAGEEQPLDSSEVARIAFLAIAQQQASAEAERTSTESKFRRNLGLAHTHVNGQTLLFFAIGVVFLFTSVAPATKKIIYWIFGLGVVMHAAGLTGQGYHWIWDDLLAMTGVLMLVVIVYMALMIFVDLGKSPRISK
jgi:hypothetical protein